MLLSKVSLAALRTFSVVARHGSLSLAADALCISPSAVSHQMKLLEGQLAVALFVRRSHGIELTDAGRRLYAQASAAMQMLESGLQQVKEVRQKHLTIAVIPAFLQLWLIPRLSRFYTRFPDIQLSFVEQDQLADFVHQEIDLNLHFGSGEFPGLHSLMLMPERVAPVCNPDLLDQLGAEKILHDQQTRRLTYVPFNEDRPGGISWQGWFNHTPQLFSPQQKETRFNHLAPMIQATCQGHGVSLGWLNLLSTLLSEHKLIVLSDIKVPLKFAYYAVAPHTHFDRVEVKLFVDWLKEEIAPQLK